MTRSGGNGTDAVDAASPAPPRRWRWVLVLPVLVWAVWRVTLGVDVGDGASAVALSMRFARGDVLFADDMGFFSPGALTAVPFSWVYLGVVGVDGIVLAARLLYVGACVAAGLLAYRGWRVSRARALPAGAACVVALLPAVYNLPVLSYNTVPALAGLVALAAGTAAVRRSARGWAVVAGVAVAVMGSAHPVMVAPGFVLLVLLLIAIRSPRIRASLLLGAGAVVVLVLGWVTLVPGWAALAETVRFTLAVQGERPPLLERSVGVLGWYVQWSATWPYLVVAVACVIAALLGRRLPGSRLLVLLAPVLLGAALLGLGGSRLLASGPVAILLTVLLLLPALSWSTRGSVERTAMALALPTALVGGVAVSLTSASGPGWGAQIVALAPALAAVVLSVLSGLERWRPVSALMMAGALVLTLTGASTATVFRNGGPGDLSERIPSGPHAGLRTTACMAELDALVAARMPSDPAAGVLVFGMAGGYVHAPGPMDSNILWMTAFDEADRQTVDWFESRDRAPEVVLVALASVREAGDYERLRDSDAIIAWAHERYGEPADVGPFLRFADARVRFPDEPAPVTGDATARQQALQGRCPSG